ncbi:MAG: ABC transporter permease, partial [Phycisphaerae bacterium]|nr:ABC transporter permease [Phycisphaerae bacterium]
LFLLILITALAEHVCKNANTFLSTENFINILWQWSDVGILAIGMTLVIILGGIDLTVGSLTALAGGIGIWVMNTIIGAHDVLQQISDARDIGMPSPFSDFRSELAHLVIQLHLDGSEFWGVSLGVFAMLGIAAAAGALNGLLIARGKIAPFITTLGGFAAYRSLALAMVDGGSFNSQSTRILPALGGGIPIPGIMIAPNMPLRLPYSVIALFVIAGLAGVILNRTRYGRYVIAIGCNERAARYSAIDVSTIKIITYTLSGLLCGIAGLMIVSRNGSIASSSTGSLYELDAIAAVVIGGTRMRGGSGSILGTLLGVMILGVIASMLNFLDVSPYLQGLVKGVIIIAAVLVQRVGGKRTEDA